VISKHNDHADHIGYTHNNSGPPQITHPHVHYPPPCPNQQPQATTNRTARLLRLLLSVNTAVRSACRVKIIHMARFNAMDVWIDICGVQSTAVVAVER
jgi:hypothetical protein